MLNFTFYLHNLANDNKDEFTARDNSTGNSGGITDVSIKIHSKNNLYLLRFGSSEPENSEFIDQVHNSLLDNYIVYRHPNRTKHS